MVEHSRELLAERDRIIEHIQNMGDEVQGTLKIGVSNNFALYKLPPIIRRFSRKFPKVKIMLKTGLGREILKELENGDIYIGIESGGHRWVGQKTLIDRSKICMISKNKFRLEDLPQQPLIYVGTPSVERVFNVWWPRRFHSVPQIVIRTDYVETCKHMVMNGLGTAFVPSFCLEENDPLFIEEIQTEDMDEEFYTESWINYKESSLELSVVKEFVNFMIADNKAN